MALLRKQFAQGHAPLALERYEEFRNHVKGNARMAVLVGWEIGMSISEWLKIVG
jgi:hypothetical protein